MTKQKYILLLVIGIFLAFALNLSYAFAKEVPNDPNKKGNIAQGEEESGYWSAYDSFTMGNYSSYDSPKTKAMIAPEGCGDVVHTPAKAVNTAEIFHNGSILSNSEKLRRMHMDKYMANHSEERQYYRENIDKWVGVDPLANGGNNLPFGFILRDCWIYQITDEVGDDMSPDGVQVSKQKLDIKVTVDDIKQYTNPSSDMYYGDEMVLIQINGAPSIHLYGIKSARVKIQYFKAGTSTPFDVSSYMTFGDVDLGQSVYLYDIDNRGYAPQAVHKNTNLSMLNATWEENYFHFGQKFNDREEHANIVEDAFGVFYYSTSLDMRFVNGYGSSGKETWHAYFDLKGLPMARLYAPGPGKYVKDSDENFRTGDDEDDPYDRQYNTLNQTELSYYYDIEQYVPLSNFYEGIDHDTIWLWNKMNISDTVVSGLTIEDVKVYSSSYANRKNWSDNDISRLFNISISNNNRTLSVSAKDDLLTDTDMYNAFYHVRVKVKIDPSSFKNLEAYDSSKYKAGYTTKSSFGNYNIKGYEDNSIYLVIPNKASSTCDTFGQQWSSKTHTFINIPKPDKVNPVKRVSDNDNRTLTGTGEEKKVVENFLYELKNKDTLKDKPYTYHVYQRLNGSYASPWYFNSFKITDDVDDLLKIVGTPKVYEHTWTLSGDISKPWTNSGTNANTAANVNQWIASTGNGTDVTSKFNISVSGNKITATAKTDELKKESFYNDTSNPLKVKAYELRFEVAVNTEKYPNQSDLKPWMDPSSPSLLLKWLNKATVNITDRKGPNDDGTSTKTTNNTITRTKLPWGNGDNPENEPSIKVTKTANPYEFRVGDTIPYTITLKNMNKNSVAYKIQAEDTSLPAGFTVSELTATGGKNPKATADGNKITVTADYLEYGDTITIKFNGKADKTLNGKVVPNTVYARAWGTADDDRSTWDKDITSVYINSPKLNITKTIDKTPDNDGNVVVKEGDTVTFTSKITNINAGTFMRNIYAIDTSETKGLVLNQNSVIVRAKDIDGDWEILDADKDYKLIPYKDGDEKVNISKLAKGGFTLDTSKDTKIIIETAEDGHDRENTGERLPTEKHDGFVLKMLGNYRNLADSTMSIPASTDEIRGTKVKYLTDDLKAIEEANGITYSTDYANLNLQREIEITYTMTMQEEGNDIIRNFIKTFATSNTNQDRIADDDTIPSGGDTSTTRRTSTPIPQVEEEKKVEEKSYTDETTLHYTISAKNEGTTTLKGIKITDEIKSKNATYNNDFEVKLGSKTLASEEFSVEEVSEFSRLITLDPNLTLRTGETFTVTYTAKPIPGTWETKEDIKNTAIIEANNWKGNELITTVPPLIIEHVKDVKENQHDGPDGEINTLNYTLTTTVKNGEATEPVITDSILSNNFVYDKDSFEVLYNGLKYTDADITVNENSFEIKLGMNLKEGDKVVVNYSGKVTDRNIVDNETIFICKEIPMGIKDYEHVPGPEDGVYVTTYKTSDPKSGSLVKTGDEITYILKVVNTGKDVSGYTQVRDKIPEGTTFKEVLDDGAYVESGNYVEWVVANLQPKESKEVRFVVTVNENPPTEIWNVAYYSTTPEDPGKPGEIPNEPTKKTEETVHYTDPDHEPHPLLSAKKSSDPETGTRVNVGDQITYSIELNNYGDADITTAGIRDYIPEGTKYVEGSADNNGVFNSSKNCIDWTNLEVKADETITVSFKVEVLSKALIKGVVENQALYQNDWTDPEKDPSSSTNIVEHPIDLIRGSQVTIYKDSNPTPNSLVKAGEEITYSLTLKNTGKDIAKFTRVRDYIPNGTTYKEVLDNGWYNNDKNYVEWVVKDLKPNAEATVKFKVTVNEDAPDIIRNLALFETTPEDPGKPDDDPTLPSNPVHHKTNPNAKTPGVIEVIKSSDPIPGTPVYMNDEITYNLLVKNTGEQACNSIVVRDYIPENTEYIDGSITENGTFDNNRTQWVIDTLEPGNSTTLSFKVKVTAKKFDLVQNQALYEDDFDPNNPKDPKNWSNIVEHPSGKTDLEHKKSVKEEATYVGHKLHYTLETTLKEGKVVNLVIGDKVTTKNLKVDTNSIKVVYNGSDITSKCDISNKDYEFIIKTNLDAKKNDKIVVTYEGTATNHKEVKNESYATGDNMEPVYDKEELQSYIELTVSIAKADKDKVTYYLKGAEITVFDEKGNIAKDKDGNECKGLTDENGKVSFIVLYLEGKKFYAQETKAPKGYYINKDKFEVKPTATGKYTAESLIKIFDKVIVIPPATTNPPSNPPVDPPQTPPTIKTGDNTTILGWIMLAITAILIISCAAITRRMRK